MAKNQHFKGPGKEGERKSKNYPTRTEYIEDFEEDLNKNIHSATSENLGGVKTGQNIINEQGTISIPFASTSTAGVTKLYDSTGTSVVGTMTQKSIKTELDNKLDKTANAVSAAKLNTARALQVTLNSNNSSLFNGTEDVKNIGVQGILNEVNGGTGKSTLSEVTVGAANKATSDGSGNIITSTYAPIR